MIETRDLRRTFKTRGGAVEAVKGVDLRLARARSSVSRPERGGQDDDDPDARHAHHSDLGAATVAGADSAAEPQLVRRRIGYVPQGGSTDPAETGRGELVLEGRLYGMSNWEATTRAAEVLATLDLEAAADRGTGTYSGGMRRRLDVGLGIVHRPSVLFLDEPTTVLEPAGPCPDVGRDPGAARPRDDGLPLLPTTWEEEVHVLADRLAIIDHGRIVAEGTSDELKQAVAGDVVTIGVNGAGPRVLGLVEKLAFVREAACEDGLVRLYVDRGEWRFRSCSACSTRPWSVPHFDHAQQAEPGRRLPAPDRPIVARGAGRLTGVRRPAPPLIGRRRSNPLRKDPSMTVTRDTWLMFQRSMRLTIRQPIWIIFGMIQPILYLVLFGPLLEASTRAAGAGTNAYNWFIPGLLIQTALFRAGAIPSASG